MPLPDLIPVVGQFRDMAEAIAAGTVKFVPSVSALRDPSNSVVYTGAPLGPYQLDAEGRLPAGVELMPTNHPDLVPQYWHWTVVERFADQKIRTWNLEVDYLAAEIDIADMDRALEAPVPSHNYFSYIDFAIQKGQPGGIATLDEDGHIPLAQMGAGRYFHTQTTPSASWLIPHNLGVKPLVQVLVDGHLVIADTEHNSDNSVTLVFATAAMGQAILSV
jgi:hypothetical protein